MKKRTIIVLSGAQCSGKTTLFEALKPLPQFKDFVFFESKTKKLREATGQMGSKDGGNEFQRLAAEACLNNHFSTQKNYVSDRSILDNAVYTDWIRIHKGLDKEVDTFCERVYRDLTPLISTLFYCEPLPLVDNGIRDIDPEYRDEIINIFEDRLDTASTMTKVIRLPAFCNVKERITLVLRHTR